ncbi:MAG TPA: diadenylate cyclase CdaA [Geobacteraceae bacterium]
MVTHMTESLHHAGWLLDLIDIGLVAFVIYRLLVLVKGAMALRLLYGLAFLLGVGIVARFMNLETVSWILDNFLASILIILVIVFQHDIRRALVVSSRGSLGREREKEEPVEIIEELVSAAEALASKHIGALIVFERDMPLDTFMGVGTDIDAKVTSELLTSIFLPYSPIHDGAVIIQKGKLTKAGCFLPLTQNSEVSKALGTRHRAAIGLSEIVDAVVIVVSEETGTIGIVVGGKITRNLDAPTLRKSLRRLLEPRWLT